MKKILIAILLSLSMILTLTACGGSGSTDTADEETVDETEYLEVPMSDATDDSGLPGTWISDTTDENDTSEYMVLALNTDDTFELYLEASSSDNAFGQLTVDGTYKAENNKLTLTYDESAAETAGDEGAKPDLGAIKSDTAFDYTLSGDTLTLKNGNDTITLDREPVETDDTTTEDTTDTNGTETTTETETETETQESK